MAQGGSIQERALRRLYEGEGHIMDDPRFLTDLDARLKDDDRIWVLDEPLVYFSRITGGVIEVPKGFETDFASVPRLPIAFALYGDRAHREGVLHDCLFREDARPNVSFMTANRIFLEAMECRGKPWYIRWPMYLAVCAGSYWCFHKRKMADKL